MSAAPVLWYPHAKQITLGKRGGSFNAAFPKKIVWHSTEGHGPAGARSAFHNYPPHFLVHAGGVEQYIPINRSSYALKRHNADGVINIEQTILAAEHPKDPVVLSYSHPLSVWLMSLLGIPNDWPCGLTVQKPDPTKKSRATPAIWKKGGHFGHCHAPDQQPSWHWDPGFDPKETLTVTPGCTVKGVPLRIAA